MDDPKTVPTPKGNGYPNNIAKTQNTKTRGTGAATKGKNFNNTRSEGPPFIMPSIKW